MMKVCGNSDDECEETEIKTRERKKKRKKKERNRRETAMRVGLVSQ